MRWREWPDDPGWWQLRAIPLALCLFVVLIVLIAKGMFRWLGLETNSEFVMFLAVSIIYICAISWLLACWAWHAWRNLARR